MAQSQYYPEIIPFREKQKWGYSDRQKNILIPPTYTQSFPFFGEIAKVSVEGKYGLIDREGKEIIPPIYNEIADFETGAFLSPDGSCSIYGEGKYGLVSCMGDILAPVEFDTPDAALQFATANGWKGRVLPYYLQKIPASLVSEIQSIKKFQTSTFPFKQNDKWGLITETGEILASPQYDDIKEPENGYWPFIQNGKWGLLKESGEVLLEARYEEARGMSNGQAACKQGTLWGAVDEQGNWVIPPLFTELGEFKDGLTAAQKNGKYGFIDEKGKTVLDFIYEDAMDFKDSVSAVFENQYRNIHFMDIKGKAISEQYTRMYGPQDDGWMHIVKGDKWGLVKSNGEFILPIEYDLPKAMGQQLQTIELGRIPIKKGALLGFANEKGEEIVPPQYVTVDPFCEGLSLVSVLDSRLNFGQTPESIEATGSISGVFNFGFIDPTGKEIVKPQYILARRFDFGLAFVETSDGEFGHITYDGTEYFTRNQY